MHATPKHCRGEDEETGLKVQEAEPREGEAVDGHAHGQCHGEDHQLDDMLDDCDGDGDLERCY